MIVRDGLSDLNPISVMSLDFCAHHGLSVANTKDIDRYTVCGTRIT